MDEIERELGKEGGPYFLGWGYSMVDIVFAPFLERIAASIPYYKVLPCYCAFEPGSPQGVRSPKEPLKP